MRLETSVQRLELALHFADARGQGIDELAAEQGSGLFGSLSGLPLVLPQFVRFDVPNQLVHPRLHFLEGLAFGADLGTHSEVLEIVSEEIAHAALDTCAF